MSIVFFDVDGTIYDYDKGIPEYVRDAFAVLRGHGHTLCLNTGRPKLIVPDAVFELGFDGTVTGTGSRVDYGDEILFENYIPKELVSFVYKDFLKRRMAFCLETYDFVYASKRMEELLYPTLESNDRRSQLEHLETNKFSFRDTMGSFDFSKDVTKVSYLLTPDESAYLKSVLGNSCFILEEEINSRGYIYGEAVCKGSSKSHGAEIICNRLGIPVSEAIAIGDGMNDLDMIKWAGIGVAMGNAAEDVKAAADYVCGSIENDGIMKAVYDLHL